MTIYFLCQTNDQECIEITKIVLQREMNWKCWQATKSIFFPDIKTDLFNL